MLVRPIALVLAGMACLTEGQRFIARLNPGVSRSDIELVSRTNTGSIEELGADMLLIDASEPILETLSGSDMIKYFEKDSVVKTAELQWNLDRVDEVYDDALKLPFGLNGAGTDIYVIDTGVKSLHQDFWTSGTDTKSRVVTGMNFVETPPVPGTGDCNGHGTHVASTAIGLKYGVATGARVIPVRVLWCNGSGLASTVIAGINWAATQPGPHKILSLSLGGGFSQAMNDAIDNARALGCNVVVAAGNEARDACNYSPASAELAISVGATMQADDAMAGYSNFGPCVEIFAPGSKIVGAWLGSGDKKTAVISGTSMATPHVSGALAILRQLINSSKPMCTAGCAAAEAEKMLFAWAQRGVIPNLGQTMSPNLFLSVRAPGDLETPRPTRPPPPTTPAPSVSPTPAPTRKWCPAFDRQRCAEVKKCAWFEELDACENKRTCRFPDKQTCLKFKRCKWKKKKDKCGRK